MKNALLIFCAGLITVVNANTQSIFKKETVQQLMDKVNNYQLNNPWKEFDDNWIRGTYYTGVMACYQATGDKKLLKQCEAWGKKLNWKLPVIEANDSASGANLLTCGQTWLECYIVDKTASKIDPIIAHLENPKVKNPVTNPLGWYFEGGRRYVDGLFTGPPALAMLYSITGEEKYLQWMNAMFWDVYGALYDREEGLFFRDIRYMYGYRGEISERWILPDTLEFEEARRSYVYQETSHGKKVIWSRGNGWAFAGLARILKYLPKDNPGYERYKAVYLRMAKKLKECQQIDGFWYPNLADAYDFRYRESSGTGFFTYGLAYGINNGILPLEEYMPVIEKSWKALVSIVSDEGKVQWGQLVGASPYKILQEDSHEYVSGIFLLAASEMYQLNL
jgi:rhamnogalacturonyl hydrolase YesR